MRIMYQSIPSLTIPPWAKPQGNFFDGRIPHPPGKKEFKTPTPRAYENELKPHPQGIFLNYSPQKHDKMRQKSCKTVRLYHLQDIKRLVWSPIKSRLHYRQIYSDKLQNLVHICPYL